jgi:hypothetical protein
MISPTHLENREKQKMSKTSMAINAGAPLRLSRRVIEEMEIKKYQGSLPNVKKDWL